MAAARVALALAFVASATQTAGAEPCTPRAELGGDAEAVAQVAIELRRLGVDASTDPMTRGRTTCPMIFAAVELDRSGGIAVAVRDAAQRSEGRIVSDAALAATWIDSWLRDDFTAPTAEAEVVSPRAVAAKAAPVAETPLLDRFSFAASVLKAWGGDSTQWSGLAVSGCVQVGGACVGARVGYAQQTVAAELSAAAKRDAFVLATASYSQAIGRMSIAPELGVGVGRVGVARVEGCEAIMTDPNCDPNTDPTCGLAPPDPCKSSPGQVYVGDGFSETTYTPRVSAALRIAIPLFDHVWLDGLAAATLAPFGHSDDYANGTKDSTMTLPAPGVFPLPGDSMFGLQLGVGLRVGAR